MHHHRQRHHRDPVCNKATFTHSRPTPRPRTGARGHVVHRRRNIFSYGLCPGCTCVRLCFAFVFGLVCCLSLYFLFSYFFFLFFLFPFLFSFSFSFSFLLFLFFFFLSSVFPLAPPRFFSFVYIYVRCSVNIICNDALFWQGIFCLQPVSLRG